MKKQGIVPVLFFAACLTLAAQTHISVPLDDPVYYLLDQAQLRGLCDPLPVVKPYSRALVIDALDVILDAPLEKLGDTERAVLKDIRLRLKKAGPGMDLKRGAYRFETHNGRGESWFSGDVGVGAQSVFSGGLYPGEGDFVWGTDNWAGFYLDGDVGEHLSFDFNIAGGLVRAPRDYL
ncbi:MAG: hypothetical protein LBQ44_06765, partial [Treponema sp.]|nr:hypothetical protein [Treponema sp.]